MKYHNRETYVTTERKNDYGSIVKFHHTRCEVSIEGPYQYKSLEIQYNTPNARVTITRTRRYNMNLSKMRYGVGYVFDIEIITDMDKPTQNSYVLGNVATLRECLVFAYVVLPDLDESEGK